VALLGSRLLAPTLLLSGLSESLLSINLQPASINLLRGKPEIASGVCCRDFIATLTGKLCPAIYGHKRVDIEAEIFLQLDSK